MKKKFFNLKNALNFSFLITLAINTPACIFGLNGTNTTSSNSPSPQATGSLNPSPSAPVTVSPTQQPVVTASPVSTNSCNWIDGTDTSAGNDPGRGSTDRQVHFDHVAKFNKGDTVPALVEARLSNLRSCLSNEQFANLYADLSVMIASAALASAGCKWVNGDDPNAGNDPGRGKTERQVHFDHVAKLNQGASVPSLVKDRLANLRGCLSNEKYAGLYADLSVLIAKTALGN
jgi:hypothetical protein